MPNIGDRLEEARKRQGISIREASEATKIRGDLLLSLENNNFDFDLPEVYKRGFLKLYGRFLKLDTDKLMTDYEAAMMGRSKVKRADSREFFGRMDLPERTTPLGSKESTPPFGAHQAEEPNEHGSPAEPMEHQSDTGLYLKIGLIFGGSLVIATLVVLLVFSIFSGGDEDANTGNPGIVDNTGGSGDSTEPAARPTQVTLIGLGDTNVIVKQLNDEQKIAEASGSIEAGEEITFTRTGPIMIVCSSIENIAVRIDGQTFRPGEMRGVRKWYFNETGPFNPTR